MFKNVFGCIIKNFASVKVRVKFKILLSSSGSGPFLMQSTPNSDNLDQDGRHLERENDIFEMQVLNNCYLFHGDRCPENPKSCKDFPHSSKTPDFHDEGAS